MIKVGIILGSTRPGRLGEQVASWVYEQAKQRTDAEYALVDVADYQLVGSQVIRTPEAGSSQKHSPPGGLSFPKAFPPAAA